MKTANKYNPYCVPGSDLYIVFKKHYRIYSSQQLYEIGTSIGFIVPMRKPGHACSKYLAWDELADGEVRLEVRQPGSRNRSPPLRYTTSQNRC